MTKNRLEAFSDGIIAIIITITILLIDLPEGDDLASLLHIFPLVICYLITFIMVGTNWVNHHHLIQAAETVDGAVLWSNLLYLFLLSFYPVTTGWVGRSLFAVLPVRVYVIINLSTNLSYCLLEWAVIHASSTDAIRNALNEQRKESWTILMDLIALFITFVPNLHYIACPLLVLGMVPWFIPDLRMQQVAEDTAKNSDTPFG